MNFLKPMLQNFSKSQQDWEINASHLKSIDKFFEINVPLGVSIWMNKLVAFIGNREITITPTCNLVEICRVGNRPILTFEINSHGFLTEFQKNESCATSLACLGS